MIREENKQIRIIFGPCAIGYSFELTTLLRVTEKKTVMGRGVVFACLKNRTKTFLNTSFDS
jgi:hypothetical protein